MNRRHPKYFYLIIKHLVNLSACLFFLAFLSCSESNNCEEYYPSGKLKYTVPCNKLNGEFDGLMLMYREDGTKKAERLFQNGIEIDTSRYYYPFSENIHKEVPMKDGYFHGKTIWYYENGNKEREVEYVNSRKQGVYRKFNEQELIIIEGEYYEDYRWGAWRLYSPPGQAVGVITYNFNYLSGPFSVLRENGLPFITGSFMEGFQNGELSLYNEEGAIIEKAYWENGEFENNVSSSALDITIFHDHLALFYRGQKAYIGIDSVFISSVQ